jgi:NAD(P)-dependent dehydrogenase (short-subunit alcohol dehydrogenase family)
MAGVLDGKIALVTGAGKGIGRGVTLALARAGATVVASGRRADTLDETLELVAGAGGRATSAICDVNDPAQIADLVETTVAAHGTIDILINNAQGQMGRGKLLDIGAEDFEAAFTSGPLATFRLMQACYPHLRGDGVIVNFGTGAGIRPDPVGYGCYAAVKEAIRALSRAAAVEWGVDGIRVHSIIPLAGSDALKTWAEQRPEESKRFFESVPLRRIGDPEEDIGRAIVFLCGPDSSYITGNSIALDGGQAYLH